MFLYFTLSLNISCSRKQQKMEIKQGLHSFRLERSLVCLEVCKIILVTLKIYYFHPLESRWKKVCEEILTQDIGIKTVQRPLFVFECQQWIHNPISNYDHLLQLFLKLWNGFIFWKPPFLVKNLVLNKGKIKRL